MANVTWTPNGPFYQDYIFNNGNNWSSGTVPGPTDTAIFGASSVTSLYMTSFGSSADIKVGTLQFSSGAPGYTFSGFGEPDVFNTVTLELTVSGIVNDSSTAPSFDLSVQSTLVFENGATAGNATISLTPFYDSGSCRLQFLNNSTAGQASIINYGRVDFSQTSGPNGDHKITAGSIAGGGTYDLGPNQLTVGSNNLSTEVSGAIAGSGSLVKVGTGTLTLSAPSPFEFPLGAPNSYTGGTTISAGTLQLGNGGSSGSILGDVTNNAIFAIDRSDVYTFGGTISGSGAFQQLGTGTTILTADNTFTGATTISAGTLQLGSGGTTGSLTGFLPLDNGVLAIDRSDTLILGNAIFGSGSLQQIGTGTTVLAAADVYLGGTTITAGTLELGNGGSVFGNVTFADNGAGATLRLDANGDQVGGSIAGFGYSEKIDLAFLPFNTATNAVWQENGRGTGGTLSLVAGSQTLASLNLSGVYDSRNFSLAMDSRNGTLVQFNVPPPPPNPSPPGDTTADMILRHGADGQYEIYDIGNNSVLAAYQLNGRVGTEWQFAGLGDFNGNDTTDMLLRGSNTGAFEVYDISKNNITGAGSLGQVGMEYQVAGFGNFNGPGAGTDMMMRNTNTGAFELYDINNNSITGASQIGQVGLEWKVAGFGDFNGDGTTDMILRDSLNGAFEVYDINNGQLTSASTLGQVGNEWQVAGFGNFDGDGTTNMMLRNVNTGTFEIYDINNNMVAGASAIGQVGLEWQVAGFGPINGAGTSDMALRNVTTGAFEVYDIANNRLTTGASLGAVGLDWQVGGIAADPPTASTGNSNQVAQLVQAMAGFGGGSGAAESLNTVALGADTQQQPLLTTPQHT